jgi:hypothetical protein
MHINKIPNENQTTKKDLKQEDGSHEEYNFQISDFSEERLNLLVEWVLKGRKVNLYCCNKDT